MYADDLVVFSTSSVGLRELLSVCETYGLNHDIKFTHKKSAILISRGKHMKNVCHLAFRLNGEDIKEVKSVKYLGHIICSDSKEDKDIMRQRRQLYAHGNVLLRKFYMCTNYVNIKLFSTFCSSMYTAQLCWNHSVYSIHRLNACYNNVFRRLLGLPKYCSASAMFAEKLTPDCKAVIRNLVYKFMSRLDKSRNSLIIAALGTDIR